LKKYNILFTTLLIIFLISTKGTRAQFFTDGLNIGAKLGSSKFLGETSADVSGRINEFESNFFSPVYKLEISKYLTSHLEVGIELGTTLLKGETQTPTFSAEEVHFSMAEPITEPVEYENNLFSQNFFVSYYLKSLSKQGNGLYLNPYIRAGIGHLVYSAKLKYIDAPPEDLIFGKGNDNFNGNTLTTAVLFFGGGIKANITENLFLLANANLNYVNYDLLDVVPNYTPTGERMNTSGLYTELKLGIFFSFGKYSGSKKSSYGEKDGSSKATNSHLPFAPRR